MTRETRVAQIPDIRDDNVAEVLRAIKNVLEVREGHIGDALDQNATLRDLVDLSVLQSGGTTALTGGTSVPVIPSFPPITGYNPSTDYTTPPAPSGLRATGGFTNVYLEWDGAPYKNHSYTEIWRSQTDSLGTAILIGTTSANVYADPARPDTTYYYWIRFVSNANITGPYNQTSGTVATTAIDVSAAITAISSDLVKSPLYVDLGTRISKVEVDLGLSSQNLAVLQSARLTLDDQVTKNGSAIVNVQKVTDQQATSITLLGTRVGAAESSITSLNSTTASQATSITSLNTRVGTAESNITTLQSTTASQASSLTTLTSSVGSNTTSIATLTSTTNGLSGQYTVKIDNNGHVSGFGLASTSTTASPTSAFIVRADKFAIAGPNDTTDPLGTTSPTKLPFIVTTSPTTVNGKTYPAGTWIDTAFVADATITSAQIGSLTADKITAGSLTAAIGVTTGRISGGVDTTKSFGTSDFGTGFYLGLDSSVFKFRVGSYAKNMTWDGTDLSITGNVTATGATFKGLTVTDGSGNVLLSSGGVPASVVSGLGALATKNSVAASDVSGLGSLATANSVTIGDNVLSASTVRIWNGFSYQLLNNYDFVNSLSKITSTNVSTFIASAAIGEAYIGNLSAAKITSGTIDADRLSSTIITGKVANLDAANITNATISTLKLAGEAVTLPRFAEQSSTGVTLTEGSLTSDLCSVSTTVSGLSAGETVRVIVVAVSQAYPSNNTFTNLLYGIYLDGVLNTEIATTYRDFGISVANVGSFFVGNGTFVTSVKATCQASPGGSSSKSGNNFITRLIVMTGKR